MPKTNEERAFERLRHAIINGELPVGEFLSQRKLAEIASVAVVTVRATLRRLENVGLVENVPRWGVRIPRETEERIRDRYYMRELLEVPAALSITQSLASDTAQRLREMVAKLDGLSQDGRPQDPTEYHEAHFDLHHYIAECSGSYLLTETLSQVFLRAMCLYNTRAAWIPTAAYTESHSRLVEDILAGDPTIAEKSMRSHIALGLQFELEALHAQEVPDLRKDKSWTT